MVNVKNKWALVTGASRGIGPHAPNDPKTALPGVVVGAFVDDKKSGRLLPAGAFYDMTLEEAVAKAETM